jgi:hypothetical protein
MIPIMTAYSDGWDMAIYDQRGNHDFDLDFLSDNVDVRQRRR